MQQQISKPIIQSSAQNWPNDQKFRQSLSLPLTLSIQPLQPIQPSILSSFPSSRINAYRCHTCKAFINYLCPILSKNQYNCSICGCTNRLPIQINSLSPQMTSNIYSCSTTNPSHRSKVTNCRTFVYIIDINVYGEQSRVFIMYAIHCIRELMKDLFNQNKQQNNNNNKENKNIQVIIFAFDQHIHQYKLKINKITKQKQRNSQNIQHQTQQYQQQLQICKQINTHLTNQHQDHIIHNSSQYLLKIPQQNNYIQIILSDIQTNITKQYQNNHINKQYSSKLNNNNNDSNNDSKYGNTLLSMIQKAISITMNCVGKIYILTGIRYPPTSFLTIQNQPQQFRQNYNLNRKKCLSDTLSFLLQKTYMSISIYIYNNSYINMLPLFAITKLTNGQLKHYKPINSLQFYYQFHYSICIQSIQMNTQTILKVRHSNGIKLVGIFGQYRSCKGSNDQIQLLSCPSSRIYLFQFKIQGIIQQPYINIQFSILSTDINNNRIFKIVTYSQKITNNKQNILNSINYVNINHSYLWAILHNMDLNVRVRNLQITLQERCRKHINAIKMFNNNNNNKNNKDELIKKASIYILFTFFLMRHFVMNTKHSQTHLYDKSIQTRSRLITGDISAIHTIWPIAYSINNSKHKTDKQNEKQKQYIKIVQMKYEQIKNSQIALLIDQGDYCYVYVMNQKIRNQARKKINNEKKTVIEVISQYKQLQNLVQICKSIQQQKLCRFVQIIWLDGLQGVCVLDEKGPLSYQNFINNLLS